MLKRFITSVGVMCALLVPSMFVDLPQVQAYTNFDSCLAGQSVRLYPNGEATDAQLNQIEAGCRSEFPGTSDPNRPLGSTVNGNSSATPRATASASTTAGPSVTSSASASSSSSATPTSDTSSTPTSSSSPGASAPSSSASRPYGGFINDSRGIPTLDPQQYVGYYQGTSFSRLTSTRDAFGYLISFALSFIGMVAIMFLIYAGFVYITANGEQGKIDKAKKLIWGTIIGIMIVFAVYAVVATLLNISAAVNPGVTIGPLNVGPGGTTLRLP